MGPETLSFNLSVLFSNVGPTQNMQMAHITSSPSRLRLIELAILGHTIAAAFIPPGTVLYHGHSPTSFDKPDWLGFDPEHSFLLCRCTCQFMSFVTTRKLRLGYLDGSSGANTVSGTLDSQDIMIWGKIRPEIFFDERERIAAICELAKQYGLDGFIRFVYFDCVCNVYSNPGLDLEWKWICT